MSVSKDSPKSVFESLSEVFDLSKLEHVLLHFLFVPVESHCPYVVFGSNPQYNFSYATDLGTGKVLVIDDDGDIAFEAAKNEKCFLQVLMYLCDYEKIDMKVEDAHIQISYLKVRAIDAAGGQFYKEYYDLIFPTDV